MKLSSRSTKPLFLTGAILAVGLTAGLIAGQLANLKGDPSSAASANITVVDNNQIIAVDQPTATQTITKTSRVTIKNTEATIGYTLSAKLEQNTLTNSRVTIASTLSSACPTTLPCELSATAQDILVTNNSNATGATGETSEWVVQITVPANTPVENYIIDIVYEEAANVDLGPPDIGAMQSLTNATCPDTLAKAYDARDGQYYYVKKIAGLCWMNSNLRYAGDGNWESSWGWADDRYATTASNTTASTNDNARPLTAINGTETGGVEAFPPSVARITDPGGSSDYTDTSPSGGFYGYLYNWCAAMGGQATACQDAAATQPSVSITICPAGWRLPTGNGGEFAALNTAINAGSTTDSAGLRTGFLAVYAGYFAKALVGQGSSGSFWSSTVGGYNYARSLYFGAEFVNLTDNSSKGVLGSLRCVL